MFLQNNSTTTHKMSHKHFPLSSGSEICECFHPVVFYLQINEQSTNKIFKANALKRYL